jgi:hypothetical protein
VPFSSEKILIMAILIATISVTRSCTSLSDSLTSKVLVGGGGGASR